MINIVLIDDEEIIVEGLSKIIYNIGNQYKVIAKYSDSIEAWNYIKNNWNKIDLIITDIRMPKMNGLELIEKIHKICPEMVCAVLTGFDEFEYAKEAIDLCVVSYLLKPVETKELKKLLQRLVISKKEDVKNEKLAAGSLSKEIVFLKNEIETNYKEFDIDVAAQQIGLSKEYLLRMFKKGLNINLSEYLTDVRIIQAKKLLKSVNAYKVYEISEMVGYTDFVYFSKLFKKKTGMTPKDYRKNINE